MDLCLGRVPLPQRSILLSQAIIVVLQSLYRVLQVQYIFLSRDHDARQGFEFGFRRLYRPDRRPTQDPDECRRETRVVVVHVGGEKDTDRDA